MSFELFDGLCSFEDFDLVKFLVTSELRLKLLLSLYYSPKTVDELKTQFKKRPENILKVLNELKTNNMIDKSDKTYYLSSTGFLVALNMENLIDNFDSVEILSDFWEKHDISNIPSEFLKRLTIFNNAELVKSTAADFAKPINTYLHNMEDSCNIHIILPVFSKIIINQIINSLTTNNGTLELITSKDIFDLILSSDVDGVINDLINIGRVKYYLVDDIATMFFTSTDKFASLYLFFNDEIMDNSNMLLVEDIKGIKRANAFFNYYRNTVSN